MINSCYSGFIAFCFFCVFYHNHECLFQTFNVSGSIPADSLMLISLFNACFISQFSEHHFLSSLVFCLCASVYIKCIFLWAHPPPAFSLSLTVHLEHLILFTSLSFLPPALWLFSARDLAILHWHTAGKVTNDSHVTQATCHTSPSTERPTADPFTFPSRFL